MRTMLLWLGLGVALAGCAQQFVAPAPGPVRITAVGYGTAPGQSGYTAGQRRLLAMRASKLDAYRALAEQLAGVRLTGNSTVSAMMIQNDSFRVYVDAIIRGARVVSINPIGEGEYETTVEIELGPAFYGCMSGAYALATPTCMTMGGVMPAI